MSSGKEMLGRPIQDMLVRIVMDAFRRTIVHYGAWFAEVEHQVGLEKAMAVEDDVWQVSMGNQMDRLGKTLDFPTENGVPAVLQNVAPGDLDRSDRKNEHQLAGQ